MAEIVTRPGFIAVLLIPILFIPPPIRITDANPVTWETLWAGQTTSLNSTLSMPFAEVNVSISSVRYKMSSSSGPSFNHTIRLNSEFTIRSETDQNATIAFIYPSSWIGYYGGVQEFNLTIKFDGEEMPYIVRLASELNFDPANVTEYAKWDYLRGYSLALTNITVYKSVDSCLEVLVESLVSTSADHFVYRYFVGSGRTWAGNPHETIRISVENNDLFLETNFSPNDALTVTGAGNQVVGVWSLDFPEFQENYIELTCVQKIWPYTTQIIDPFILQVGIIIGVVMIAVVVVVVGIKMGSKS